MVTEPIERRGHARFALSRVKELAEKGSLMYPFRRVQEHLGQLGFDKSDVCECLVHLSDGDFQESLRYEDQPDDWHDVYRCVWPDNDGNRLDLYIKFRLCSLRNWHTGADTILLCSFHPVGAL